MHYSPQCGAQGKSFVGSRACLTSPGHGSADFRIACPTNIFGELGRRAAPRPAKLGRLGPDGGGSSWPICRNQRCYKTRVARKKPNRYSNRGRCRPRVGLINDNGHHSPNAGRLLGKVVDKLLEILVAERISFLQPPLVHNSYMNAMNALRVQTEFCVVRDVSNVASIQIDPICHNFSPKICY